MIVEREKAGFQIAPTHRRPRHRWLRRFKAARDARPHAGFRVTVGQTTWGYIPRHRIEHSQVVSPTDFARFRDLEVIASMQPAHAISDKRWAQDRLGEYRVLGAYSWHTMRSFGVRVPFGTDCRSAHSLTSDLPAVTRQTGGRRRRLVAAGKALD